MGRVAGILIAFLFIGGALTWWALDPSLNDEELTRDAGELCRDAQAEIDAVPAADDLVGFVGTADRTDRILVALVDDLDALDVNGGRSDRLDEIMAAQWRTIDAVRTSLHAAVKSVPEIVRESWTSVGDWAAVEDAAADVSLQDCLLDLTAVAPPDDGPLTDVGTTDPTTDPAVVAVDPGRDEPGPFRRFTVMDPTRILVTPGGFIWAPYDIDKHGDFYDSVARTAFDDALLGLAVGDIVDQEADTFAMIAREFFWSGIVEGSELATSLESVYLDSTEGGTPLELAGIAGLSYLEEDGSTGWIGHTGRFSVVLQFGAGLDVATVGDAYMAANY